MAVVLASLCAVALLSPLVFLPKEAAAERRLQATAARGTVLMPMEKPMGESVSVFYVSGDRGDDVLSLENALLSLGYDVGNVDGIYSHQTAAALRRFQSDRGLYADGICTDALRRTATALAGSGYVREKSVSDGILADALYRAGYMTEEAALASTENRQLLRDALILFQRAKGLNGVGESNYATLCALGLGGMFVYGDAGENDLQAYLIGSYLARFSAVYPDEADLHTLICVASCIYNRAVLYGGGEPMLSVVCSSPIEGEKRAFGNAVAPDALCLRAAEDALLRMTSGDDPVRGATAYCHISHYEEYAEGAQSVTRRVGDLYFLK